MKRILIAVFALAPLGASADVIDGHDWSDSDGLTANCRFECFGYIGAEFFTLDDTYTIESASFEAWNRRVDDDTSDVSVDWYIYTADLGSVITSGTVAPTQTNLGPVSNSPDIYDRTAFDLLLPTFDLGPGTYWIGFQVNLFSSDGFSIFWAETDLGDGVFARQSTDGGASWSNYGESRFNGPSDYVFSISGSKSGQQVQVPEPGTLALLGAGLIGMGFARRRKKA